MTREARLTQKHLEGAIICLVDEESANLYSGVDECSFCKKYGVIEGGRWVGSVFYHVRDCSRCPIYIGLGQRCNTKGRVETIADYMGVADVNPTSRNKAIIGALAIYMWLFEL